MKLNKKNNSGFSIIIVVFLVGFMLMLTTGTYNLILTELNDNRGAWSYLNAFAGAEGGQELALLKIKEKGYGIDDDIKDISDSRSIVLSQNPTNKSLLNQNRDVIASYNLNTKVNSYSGVLAPLSYSIIPLFYIDSSGIFNGVRNIKLSSSDIGDNIAWNIVGTGAGISGTGIINDSGFKTGFIKTLDTGNSSSFETKKVSDFLISSGENYLIILNSSSSSGSFQINSTDYFTRPETEISSSAQVGIYKQNLTTKLDNTEFLNILKYSIFSGE